ncbi:hypothetical protein PN498_15060 [Oscillatoria sp. CS-180]|uniref:hypothetical protein n=1 Tax=Oscillatoria sp. CS-180 TaxID=3021720 RepID=UPI00232F629E|nr:hypothetical protein [Oscillatoria sp. CS-180]MDB9527318.1 hypothetical protein [Oscillatoria sp. CS-180]
MNIATTIGHNQAFHQRRLREVIKRLVIELGYLENCLEKGLNDPNIETAAARLDTAIDCLNEHLVD